MFKFTQTLRSALILLTILILVNTEIINTKITSLRRKARQQIESQSHDHEDIIFDGPSEEVTLKLNFRFDKDLNHFKVEQVQQSDSNARTQDEIEEDVSTTDVETEYTWINQSYIVNTTNRGSQGSAPEQINSENQTNSSQVKEIVSEVVFTTSNHTENEGVTNLTTAVKEDSVSSTNGVPISSQTIEDLVEPTTPSDGAIQAPSPSSSAPVESNSSSTQNTSNAEILPASSTESKGSFTQSSSEGSPTTSKEVESSAASTSQSNQTSPIVPNILIAPQTNTLPAPEEAPLLAESLPQIFISPAPRRPQIALSGTKVEESDGNVEKSNKQPVIASNSSLIPAEASNSQNQTDKVEDVASQPEVTTGSTIKLTDYLQPSVVLASVVESQENQAVKSTSSLSTDSVETSSNAVAPSQTQPLASSQSKEGVKSDSGIQAIPAATPSDSSDIEPMVSEPAPFLPSESSSSSKWSLFGN